MLDGTKILKEAWGENTLVPLYDNEDSVCGILYNDTPYFFLKNLQGDVIAIVDKDATTVARYSYDAWGIPTVTLDASDCQIATVNPYRYRSYYYDAEIAKYYLQSRYYDPDTGRFINGDRPEFSLFSTSVVAHDLFAYCLNSPTNFIDPTGYVALVDDLAIAALLAAFAILMLLLALVSTPEFKKAWNAFCVDVGNGMAWIGTAIINGGKAIWDWTRAQVKAAMAAVSTFTTVVRADAKIRSTVKRNSRQRYWTATLRKNHVDIGRAISYGTAVKEVSRGRNVFTVTRAEAKAVAKAAYANKSPYGPEKHGNGALGYYDHYHVYQHKHDGHVFFLFW